MASKCSCQFGKSDSTVYIYFILRWKALVRGPSAACILLRTTAPLRARETSSKDLLSADSGPWVDSRSLNSLPPAEDVWACSGSFESFIPWGKGGCRFWQIHSRWGSGENPGGLVTNWWKVCGSVIINNWAFLCYHTKIHNCGGSACTAQPVWKQCIQYMHLSSLHFLHSDISQCHRSWFSWNAVVFPHSLSRFKIQRTLSYWDM